MASPANGMSPGSGQGIAHGKAIKAKASGRQGMARLYARKSQGMASR